MESQISVVQYITVIFAIPVKMALFATNFWYAELRLIYLPQLEMKACILAEYNFS